MSSSTGHGTRTGGAGRYRDVPDGTGPAVEGTGSAEQCGAAVEPGPGSTGPRLEGTEPGRDGSKELNWL